MSMIGNDLMAKITGFWFFYRWHPEVALRYLPIAGRINKLKRDVSILEVGSGGLGIAPYLKRTIIGVDSNFSPPFHPRLKKVKGSATKLPFPDASFNVIISVDMLEHLKPKERIKAIREMLRVGKNRVYLAVPCGENSFQQDLFLSKLYMKQTGNSYPFLEEQIHLGLPDEKELYDTIRKEAEIKRKKVEVSVFGNENLQVRSFLMRGFMTRNFIVDVFFRKLLLFAIPILRFINHEPTYRKLFIIDILSENHQ